jgi:hypothetical protein
VASAALAAVVGAEAAGAIEVSEAGAWERARWLAPFGGAIASGAYDYYGGPYYGGYYPGYSYYPAYVGCSPYSDCGPGQAIQEPGAARFYRPYGYGWRP